MEINKILTADILDIIFDGKNKQYGAYDLRKTYNSRLKNAVIITISLVLLAFLGTILSDYIAKNSKVEIEVLDTQMAEVK
ncbi:MAG: energy transducer TonB, partial [Chitinophagia bacterium]|nr:energy transducer TonB [Chitinophagia bacterium]